MIIEYHRPNNIEDALRLLSRSQPVTVPLAGGSAVNQPSPQQVAVVDLQSLRLDTYQLHGKDLELGATLTLQSLLERINSTTPTNVGIIHAFTRAVQHEATYNLRQVATIAGTLVSADGRSPFTTVMLALDATVIHLSTSNGIKEERIGLGDLLPFRREILQGSLITRVVIPAQVILAYESVARTPSDLPIVCVAVTKWPSGRTRVSLGGYGREPCLAFDGSEAQGAEISAEDAYSHASDEWASAEYRSDLARILTKRCIEILEEQGQA